MISTGKLSRAAFALVALGLAPSPAFAAEAVTVAVSKIDSGDTAWILISTALVMLMTPGLALFYGGMVRRKNVLGTLMHSFIAIALVSVQWILFGYSLAFGPDVRGFIGNLDWAGLAGVGLTPNPDYAATVPHLAFMAYQMMFAVITPALISGAFAERMKFSAYLVFALVWTTVVYDPVAHWVWGAGGWMKQTGVLDFAGGIVVHATSGFSALAAALYIGKRKGFLHEPMPPHDLPMTVLGAGILWFGWFGFNAGSALASGELAALAFVTTHTAAVAGTLTWTFAEWLHRGKPTMFGAATGAIAGLATITPAAGFVGPMPALAIGMAAGLLCYTALNAKTRFGYDDSLDAFGVHGVGGTLGTVMAGIFATVAINPGGANGFLFGNPHQLVVQIQSVFVVALYSFVVSLVLFKVIDAVIGLRVSSDDETEGLDITQHGEAGYTH
ncbi:MAG: ammonia channel protein [Nitrospirae bacterium GWC2_57_13]|nr:MAG: ammonia channel protein [Nitrospirae bacterium GWC2_57_13]OGW43438.1 MAG: ammonia channel protein [Nitrospirae bacterium GWD2_57_8]HAS54192.1 ammonia channel protein [Nitrospiraceae bacterium]